MPEGEKTVVFFFKEGAKKGRTLHPLKFQREKIGKKSFQRNSTFHIRKEKDPV